MVKIISADEYEQRARKKQLDKLRKELEERAYEESYKRDLLEHADIASRFKDYETDISIGGMYQQKARPRRKRNTAKKGWTPTTPEQTIEYLKSDKMKERTEGDAEELLKGMEMDHLLVKKKQMKAKRRDNITSRVIRAMGG